GAQALGDRLFELLLVALKLIARATRIALHTPQNTIDNLQRRLPRQAVLAIAQVVERKEIRPRFFQQLLDRQRHRKTLDALLNFLGRALFGAAQALDALLRFAVAALDHFRALFQPLAETGEVFEQAFEQRCVVNETAQD